MARTGGRGPALTSEANFPSGEAPRESNREPTGNGSPAPPRRPRPGCCHVRGARRVPRAPGTASPGAARREATRHWRSRFSPRTRLPEVEGDLRASRASWPPSPFQGPSRTTGERVRRWPSRSRPRRAPRRWPGRPRSGSGCRRSARRAAASRWRWPERIMRTPFAAKAASAASARPTKRVSGALSGGRNGWWATTIRNRCSGSARSRSTARRSRLWPTWPCDQSRKAPAREAVLTPTTATSPSAQTGSGSSAMKRRQRPSGSRKRSCSQ